MSLDGINEPELDRWLWLEKPSTTRLRSISELTEVTRNELYAKIHESRIDSLHLEEYVEDNLGETQISSLMFTILSDIRSLHKVAREG